MADVTLNIRHNAAQAAPAVGQLADEMGRMAKQSKSASTAGAAAANGFNKIGAACLDVGKSAKTGASGISKFTSSLGRIAYYRLIRTAIKYVGQAFNEGLKAAYAFSKASQPADYAKLAGAMDSLKASAKTMSLQLGAAFGGLLTAITPVLIQIINLVTEAADAITRLFAVLNGSGYYKKAASGFEEVGNSAGGAGKKIKGLLASWDELNVIGKESGGGGGGSSSADYSGAYVWEEATFDFDPANMARKISTALKDALDTAINALENYDWTALGRKIGEFIANVDWTGLVHRISELLGAALGALGETIRSALDTAFGDIEGDETLAATINKAFGWIIDDVIKPFGEGFLKAAGLDGLVQAWNLRLDQLKAAIKYALSNIEVMWRSWYAVFLESLDNPIMAPILDLLNVDLPAAINKNNEALHDAEMEADVAAITYRAVTKTIKDLKKESENPVTVKVDSDVKEPDVKLGPEKFFSHGKVVGEGYAYEIIPQLKEKLNISDWLSGNGSGHNDGVSSTGNGLALSLSVIPSLGERSKFVNDMEQSVTRHSNPWRAWTDAVMHDWSHVKEYMGSQVERHRNPWRAWTDAVMHDWTHVKKYMGSQVERHRNPWRAWTDAVMHDWTHVKKYMGSEVERHNKPWRAWTDAVMHDWTHVKKYMGSEVERHSNPWSAWTDAVMHDWTHVKKYMGSEVERHSNPWSAWTDAVLHSWSDVNTNMEKNVTRKSKPWQAVVEPKLNNTKQYIDDIDGLTEAKTVKIKPELTDAKKFKEQLQSALKASASIKTTVSGTTTTIGKVSMSEYAQGGWPNIGDLFIANEAGPELVGTIGGSTAVANNDDIVQGIQGGVERANAEQNELLRNIYSGVVKLLEKDLTISPSVALGQVVARSTALYGRA